MAVQKYDIAILSRRKTVIKFLKNFLKGKRIYKPHFFSIPDLFITYLSDNPPQALLIEDSFLPVVSERILKFPTIVIIAGDIKIGIENAINYNVNRYIYKPYMDKDLEYKLESIILEKDSIEKMKNEIKELEVITGLTQVISSTLDPQEILFRIVRQIAEVMPVTRCSIIRVDWLPEILAALTAKKPVVIEDVRTDPIMKKVQKIIEPLDIRSILVIPILFKEKVIGTLFLRTARSGRTFSENEIRLLNAIGSASSNALHNAFLFEQIEDEKTRLEKLAITDYLTGIYNIRYFYHRIIEEFSRCERYAFPISCLMLDIDHFKVINDVYGHKTGDKVLKEFSQLLKKCTRRSDVLARYGGEEFIVLLPQTSDEGAFLEAERLRKAVKGHKFKSIKAQRKLTSSFGVATYPNKDIKSHDELISAADDALFKAKNSGRDRVEVCGR
jgi:diguanylate cyclase (GGDEF)-like protein